MSQIKQDFTIAFHLSSVSRFSRDHLLKPETVLEHVGFCAFYGLLIAQRYEKTTGNKIDYGVLYRKITIHDLDEAILGDVPRTTKYFSKNVRKAFQEIEQTTIKQLFEQLSLDLYDDWAGAKEGIEGQILSVVDLASVVYKNWAEVKMLQNRSILRVAIETQKYLTNMEQKKFPQFLWETILDLQKLNYETLNSFPPDDEDFVLPGIGEK